jgi:hypothetical protein
MSSKLNFAAGGALLFLALTACSVNVKKNDGNDKNVDIKTPLGGIHVSNDADAHDTGLPVYPGSRLDTKDKDGDQQNANVNISGFGFGVKVIAVEYASDDPPDRLIAFYQNQLKKFGNVIQCHSNHVGFSHDYDDKGLKCDEDNNGKSVELKAGTEADQHIVSIEPEGKGTKFALVFVRTHGKEGSI